MTFYKKVFFALMILAMGFSGGVFAQLWFSPTPAEAANNKVFQGSQVFLYGADRKPRLQLGTYDGSYSKAEKGLPADCSWGADQRQPGVFVEGFDAQLGSLFRLRSRARPRHHQIGLGRDRA